MTAENFCYWLKGIFEIQEAGFDKNEKRSIKLTEAQIDMINQHLGYVFQSPVNLALKRLAEGSGVRPPQGIVGSILDPLLTIC